MKKTILLLLVCTFVLLACSDPSKTSATSVPAVPILATGQPAVMVTLNSTQYADIGLPCPSEFTSIAELEGKKLFVKTVENGQSFCLLDTHTKSSYLVKNDNFFAIRYLGYERDDLDFTVQSDRALALGKEGVLKYVGDNGDLKIYDLTSIDKSYENILGSSMDIAMMKEWPLFRQRVIDHYKNVMTMPDWMMYDIDGEFTPSSACWSASGYKDAVEIGGGLSFCQESNAWGRLSVASYLFLEGEQPQIFSLIPVFPYNSDVPTEIEIGQSINELKFVGCFPVEGAEVVPYSFSDGNRNYFTYQGRKYYGPGDDHGNIQIKPVGVIFEFRGGTFGEVIPFESNIEYSSWVDSNYQFYLFGLPTECDFTK